MLDRNENQEKYKECLNYVFECGDNGTTDLTQIVNHMDNHSNVPLHYATNYWDQQIVRKVAPCSIGQTGCHMTGTTKQSPQKKLSISLEATSIKTSTKWA